MSDVLTFDKVRVQCPYPIQFITGLELTSCVNEHSRVSVTGVLFENEQDGCIGVARVADPIDILEIGEHGEAPLFSGVVTSLKVRHESGLYHVEIEGQSRTYQMDLKTIQPKLENEQLCDMSLLGNVIVAQSLWDLRNKGVRIPTSIPWN